MGTKSHATMYNRKNYLAATNLPAPVRGAAYSSHSNFILRITTGGLLLTQKLLTRSPLYRDLACICTHKCGIFVLVGEPIQSHYRKFCVTLCFQVSKSDIYHCNCTIHGLA